MVKSLITMHKGLWEACCKFLIEISFWKTLKQMTVLTLPCTSNSDPHDERSASLMSKVSRSSSMFIWAVCSPSWSPICRETASVVNGHSQNVQHQIPWGQIKTQPKWVSAPSLTFCLTNWEPHFSICGWGCLHSTSQKVTFTYSGLPSVT